MPRPRPYVHINMAMSLDGKINSVRREKIALGSEHDRRLMDELRADADAVIVGAGSIRLDGFPILIRYDDLKEQRTARGLSLHPVNVTLSHKLELPSSQPFFGHAETRKIIFTTTAAPEEKLEQFSRLAEIIVLPGPALSPSGVLDALHERKIDNILLEGGGELNFAFVRDGLADRIYITLTPKLIGGASAPTVLDGDGFPAADCPGLRLVSAKQIGDELFLEYEVIRK